LRLCLAHSGSPPCFAALVKGPEMNTHRFDALTTLLGRWSTRRGALSILGSLVIATRRDAAAAEKREQRKKRRKNKKKPALNLFGCLNVGKRCRRSKRCCSGICAGPKGKERCKAHDRGGCPVTAAGACFNGTCTTSSGDLGRCMPTTGNASYCGADSTPCVGCQTDAECRARCGPEAACITCGACVFAGSLTYCAGVGAISCI
jgi:hypothetical protein